MLLNERLVNGTPFSVNTVRIAVHRAIVDAAITHLLADSSQRGKSGGAALHFQLMVHCIRVISPNGSLLYFEKVFEWRDE